MQTDPMIQWLQQTTLLGQSLSSLCTALLTALLAYLLMRTALRVAQVHLRRLSERSSSHVPAVLLEVVSGTSTRLMALVALLIALNMLDLSDRWATRVAQLWFIALVLQVALWANRGVQIALEGYVQRHPTTAAAQPSVAGALIGWGLRCVLWSIVLLAVLSNLGVNITAFIASLGVGGIAVALAAQNVLGDLFASVAIAMDKPFEVGDFVVFGSVAGTVEYVGIKTTRIRSLGGEQIVLSNTALLGQTVSNYKRLAERRIVFTFGVGYDTTAAQAEEIARTVEDIVSRSDRLRFDRAHLKGFSQSALDYEVVYIVKDPGYNVYMDEQQRINLALMRALQDMGVSFAMPRAAVQVAPPVTEAPTNMPAMPSSTSAAAASAVAAAGART